MYYESRYRVDGREVDHRGQCRMSALLGFLQESGGEAAASLGLSHREMLEKYHAFWMLARIRVELEQPLRLDDVLTVRTWHRSAKGAVSYRDFDLYLDGRPIGQAISAWVAADADSRRLLRPDRMREFHESAGEGLGKTTLLSHLTLPAQMQDREKRRLQYSEQDLNGHINNTRYADYACDALRMERLDDETFIRSMQVGFLSECRAGERLLLSVGRQDGMEFVRGTGEDGKAHFEAAVCFQTPGRGEEGRENG